MLKNWRVLKNTSSGIQCLDLQHNFMDDDGIGFLVGGLFESVTIKSLDLSSQGNLTQRVGACSRSTLGARIVC